MYSSTFSLTLKQDRVGGRCQAPAALPPRERPGSHWTGARVDQSGCVCGKLRPTGIRTPDRPACNESLNRLRYPDPRIWGKSGMILTEEKRISRTGTFASTVVSTTRTAPRWRPCLRTD